MAVLTSKPTSPGRRHVVRVVSDDLHKGAPYKPLLEKQSRNGGRNNKGRITTRHIGGGHKQHYRVMVCVAADLVEFAEVVDEREVADALSQGG